MWLTIHPGRATKLAELEIKGSLARDAASAFGLSIVTQSPLGLHTDKLSSSWGKPPQERAASIRALGLSNWLPRLGGSIRLIEADGRAAAASGAPLTPTRLVALIVAAVPPQSGKAQIGLTSLSSRFGPAALRSLVSPVKRKLAARGQSARLIIPQKGIILSAAAVRHNRLLTHGYEFVIMPNNCSLGLTLDIYDPDRDAWLDRGIPRANAHAGMLPPKLARMMVNIASGSGAAAAARELTVYDPFCGTGRVLLEALALGFPVVGSDIAQQQVAAAAENLAWWQERASATPPVSQLSVADARQPRPPQVPHVLVSEPWLGPPLRGVPTVTEARRLSEEVGTLLLAALPPLLAARPLAGIVALPRWRVAGDSAAATVAVWPRVREALASLHYSGTLLQTVARPQSIVARDIILLQPLTVTTKKDSIKRYGA